MGAFTLNYIQAPITSDPESTHFLLLPTKGRNKHIQLYTACPIPHPVLVLKTTAT